MVIFCRTLSIEAGKTECKKKTTNKKTKAVPINLMQRVEKTGEILLLKWIVSLHTNMPLLGTKTEAYSGPYQISLTEFFAKKVNDILRCFIASQIHLCQINYPQLGFPANM